MDIFTKSVTGQLQKTYTEEVVKTYDLKFLLDQKKRLEAELAEVNGLIAEANKLNIKVESGVSPE